MKSSRAMAEAKAGMDLKVSSRRCTIARSKKDVMGSASPKRSVRGSGVMGKEALACLRTIFWNWPRMRAARVLPAMAW